MKSNLSDDGEIEINLIFFHSSVKVDRTDSILWHRLLLVLWLFPENEHPDLYINETLLKQW
jgi:hypothetical protein